MVPGLHRVGLGTFSSRAKGKRETGMHGRGGGDPKPKKGLFFGESGGWGLSLLSHLGTNASALTATVIGSGNRWWWFTDICSSRKGFGKVELGWHLIQNSWIVSGGHLPLSLDRQYLIFKKWPLSLKKSWARLEISWWGFYQNRSIGKIVRNEGKEGQTKLFSRRKATTEARVQL